MSDTTSTRRRVARPAADNNKGHGSSNTASPVGRALTTSPPSPGADHVAGAEFSAESTFERPPMISAAALADEPSLTSTGRGLSSSPAPIDIVLAYQQSLVRSGLRMLLDGVAEFSVVAEAEDFEGARRYVCGHHPRVLILDLDLEKPGLSASAAILLVRGASPETGLVVLSLNEDVAVAREAIAAGALGYLPTSATAPDLVEAVRRAGSGRSYLSPAILAAIANPPGPAELSTREAEVVRLIAMGFTSAEMAERMFLSVRTIEAYRGRIQMKLGHLTRAGIVAYAVEHGMTRSE